MAPPPGPPGAGTPGWRFQVTAPARRRLAWLAGVPARGCDESWTVLDGSRRWVELDCIRRAGQRAGGYKLAQARRAAGG